MALKNKFIVAMFASIFIISSLTFLLFDGGINKNFNQSLPPKWKINIGKDGNVEYLNDKKNVNENNENNNNHHNYNNANNHNANSDHNNANNNNNHNNHNNNHNNHNNNHNNHNNNHNNHNNNHNNHNNNNHNNNNNNKNGNNNNNNNNNNNKNQQRIQNTENHNQQSFKKKESSNIKDNRHKLPRFKDESHNPFNRIDKVYKENEKQNIERSSKVREAMKFSWDKYKENAWGHDELHPVSNTWNDWFGMGLTIVDSLDTLYLMGLKNEYNEGREWLEKELKQKKPTGLMISVFETIIRFLGQYCTMYDLTGDEIYREKGRELGDLLLHAFPEGKPFPHTSINLADHRSTTQSWMGECVVLSEVGTIFLEFNHLSKITGDPKYKEYSDGVVDALAAMKPTIKGLLPIYVSMDAQRFCNSRVSVGAMGDSYYEYLLKMWIYHDGREERYSTLFQESADAIIEHLYKVSPKGDGYITIMDYDVPTNTQEHLTCFAGGMYALAAVSNITGGDVEKDKLYMKVGEEVTKTCTKLYLTSATGLGPETAYFNQNGEIEFSGHSAAPHYILRPETVESLFILYRLTGDTIYQDWAWQIFESINSVCRTNNGFAGVKDVSNIHTQFDDNQQSFFMAETLKYLYLIFQPSSVIPLNKYVFNTEAHPVKIQYQ